MKKVIGNKIALQRYDVRYLLHELAGVPKDVLDEIIVSKMIFMVSPLEDYGFCCVFERPESVEWLMEQEYIVDFDEYECTSAYGLEYKLRSLQEYYGLEENCYELHPDGYFVECLEEPGNQNNPHIHELASFAILHWARTNMIEFELPDFSPKVRRRQSLIQRLFNMCSAR